MKGIDTLPADFLEELVQELTRAIRSIAHGDISGPADIEHLDMMLEKELGDLSMAVHDIATALREIADAISNSS